MKLFCAYAFTGEEEKEVAERMRLVVETLKAEGNEVYCNLFDPQYKAIEAQGVKALCLQAFENLKRSDIVVAIVASERRSVGQLMEIGAALALGKPVYLLQHQSAEHSSYLPELAEKSWVWQNSEELKRVLQEFSAALKTE